MSYQFCMCQHPKRMKNDANGQSFEVCALSKGGCGKEIGKQVDFGKLLLGADYSDSKMRVPLEIDSNDIIGLPTLKPCLYKDTCPDCDGGGMIAKLYPNGHTEVSCETCYGTGLIDVV